MAIDLPKYQKEIEALVNPDYIGVHLYPDEFKELIQALEEAKEIFENQTAIKGCIQISSDPIRAYLKKYFPTQTKEPQGFDEAIGLSKEKGTEATKKAKFQEHIESPSCWCSPKKIFEPDMEVPLYVHNKLEDNPQ